MAVLDHQKETTVSTQSEMYSVRYKNACLTCGKRGHPANKCRFRQMTCYKCGKQGHLQAVCREQVRVPDKHTVKQLEPATEQEDEMTIWTITGGQAEGYYIHLTINSAPVKMELDTGAAVSVMCDQQWKRMFGETVVLELYKEKPLQGYSGHEVQVIGQAKVEVEYGNQRYQLPLLVVAGTQRPPLFSRNWLQSIQLDWTALHQLRETALGIVGRFPAVFGRDVGTIKEYKAIIRLRQGTKPIFKKSRSVAYALQPSLELELNRMQQEGILEPVKRSEWATPLVIIPKSNGKLRVCGDFKVTINQCVETKTYPLPTIDDIFARLAGGRIFTKLDLSQAYLQLPVDDDSKDLLVIKDCSGIIACHMEYQWYQQYFNPSWTAYCIICQLLVTWMISSFLPLQ